MTFQRRFLLHGDTPHGTPVLLAEQAVSGCWFELHRRGGCGTCQLVLNTDFLDRAHITPGDWISLEARPGERWYLGRVEERTAESPARSLLRLEGMALQLNTVFPGGFGLAADGQRPHRLARTDLFSHDPDRSAETFDVCESLTELLELLLEQYVVPQTDIAVLPERIEAPLQAAELASLKFRGEESMRGVLKELALRAQGASWGVDASGEFFFLQQRTTSNLSLMEGVNLLSLQETQDRELLFNRLLLTGDYVYDRRENSEMIARRSFRWRGTYFEPGSRATFGDRRIRLWVPWVRTQTDAQAFSREFFRSYALPQARYQLQTTPVDSLPLPWEGAISLFDRQEHLLIAAQPETVRVLFDRVPRLVLDLGPPDPRELWPEPPHDERWELPEQEQIIGGSVSLPEPLPPQQPGSPPANGGSPPGGGGGNPPLFSSGLHSSQLTSELISDGPASDEHVSDDWNSSWFSHPSDSDTESAEPTPGGGGGGNTNGGSGDEDPSSGMVSSDPTSGTGWSGSASDSVGPASTTDREGESDLSGAASGNDSDADGHGTPVDPGSNGASFDSALSDSGPDSAAGTDSHFSGVSSPVESQAEPGGSGSETIPPTEPVGSGSLPVTSAPPSGTGPFESHPEMPSDTSSGFHFTSNPESIAAGSASSWVSNTSGDTEQVSDSDSSWLPSWSSWDS